MQRFYAVHLNPGSRGRSVRFALYTIGADGQPQPLGWPTNGREARALPCLLYSTEPGLPAFHFKVTPRYAHWVDKVDKMEGALCQLAHDLAPLYGQVEIHHLNGWYQTPVRARS